MPRVKRAMLHLKKRRKLMKAVKGYKWGRKKTIKLARPAMLKAGVYAYRDRRNKKRERRSIWLIQINAACRELGTTYSKLTAALKKGGIELDRKILSELARNHQDAFSALVKKVS